MTVPEFDPITEAGGGHGGARRGAGRPRTSDMTKLTIYVSPETAERFRKMCDESGYTQTAAFDAWVSSFDRGPVTLER